MTGPKAASIVAVCAGLVLGACVRGEGPAIDAAAAPVTGDPVIYVAIGASETSFLSLTHETSSPRAELGGSSVVNITPPWAGL